MNELIEKSTKEFLNLYKTNLRAIGIEADSSVEQKLLNVLINTAKQWSSKLKYNKILFNK